MADGYAIVEVCFASQGVDASHLANERPLERFIYMDASIYSGIPTLPRPLLYTRSKAVAWPSSRLYGGFLLVYGIGDIS